MKLISLFFCLILLISTHSIRAAVVDETHNELEILSLKNIPAKDVNCILHDSKGFMWIGTLDGLHRFDGYNYKTYRINREKNAISSNMIIALDEDSKGNIWIGTYGSGICKLDPKTDHFTSYKNTGDTTKMQLPNDIMSMLVDDNDYLWIGSWFGLLRVKLDENNTKINEIIPVEVDSLKRDYGNRVKAIFQDNQKNIWIGTNYVTARIINPYSAPANISFESFDTHTETICEFENGILSGGLHINSITKNPGSNTFELKRLREESTIKLLFLNGKIWSGQRTGVNSFEKDPNGIWQLKRTLRADFSETSLSSNITTALIADDVGQIWLGTRGGGVDIISSLPNRFQHYKHTRSPGSVANDLVMSVFEDSYESLWLGTEEKGVSVLKKGRSYSSGFQHLVVNDFLNENRGYAITETQTPASKNHKSLVWVGTSHYRFLTAFNPVTLQPVELPEGVRDIQHVFALENQDDSILWVGSYSRGLWRLKLDGSGNIAQFDNFTPQTNPNFLSFIIRSIYYDSKGNIWIGTDKGINRLPKNETTKDNPVFEAFTLGKDSKHLSHDYILQITEARNGIFWIGTMGGGLLRYEAFPGGDYAFATITTNDGLPNNTIKTIVEDDEGFLWLASNKGLTRYNPADGGILNFDKEDGLQDNVFSEICGLKRKNGEIVLGGINGFSVFRPGNLPVDKTEPRMYFTSFSILNKDVTPGEPIDNRVVLKKTIENTHEITLDYKHNSFSIGFVGIQYNSPQKNNYRYILEGFDKEWYKASPDYRVARYTNIPDGEYIFRVMGSNSDNIWTDKPIELKITIKPPRYRSMLAILIYLVVGIILLIVIYRVVTEITQRRRDLLLANVEKERVEEISKIKLQFFTNISHEFRTPLSLIAAPLDQIISEGEKIFSKRQLYNLNLIKYNVGVMMRLINQLLDFRKLDQNKLQLKASRQNLNHFLGNIFQAFEVLAKQKKITYKFYRHPGGDEIWIDVDKMEKVIYNLLSNAFKYTNENGRIILKAEADLVANQFIITVSDSGIGIADSEASHIFERYYQADNHKKQGISGTGIGLALAKGIVDLHQGEIGFYPNGNEGTVFYVKLKMGNAHFATENMTATQELSSLSVPEYVSPVNEPSYREAAHPAPGEKFPKMLIVEDNFDLRKQVKNIFRNEYRIFEAEDGEAGLKICKEKQPDIVVTDVMMPKMNGMELCKNIKEDEEISHIPVMLLTAKNTDETIVEGYEYGADGYVAKPFNVNVLVARVNSLIINREKLRLRFQKEIEINPKIISNTPADSKFLDKILEFIENHLSESEYSVEQLAEDYGVSRVYLNRKIKALTGETTIEFMRNIKLKHAAELLKQNKLNVSEVAWDVGYNDLRTFRKRFKEKFEMSPSEFAKRYK